MATFEERLTKLRTKAGVSQQAIGDALNVSRWAVHNYEAALVAARGRPQGSPLRRYVLGRVPCWMYPWRWGLTPGTQ